MRASLCHGSSGRFEFQLEPEFRPLAEAEAEDDEASGRRRLADVQ